MHRNLRCLLRLAWTSPPLASDRIARYILHARVGTRIITQILNFAIFRLFPLPPLLSHGAASKVHMANQTYHKDAGAGRREKGGAWSMVTRGRWNAPWVGLMSNGFTSIRRIAWRAGSSVRRPPVRLSLLHVHVKVMDENEFLARDPMQHPLRPRALGAACLSVGMSSCRDVGPGLPGLLLVGIVPWLLFCPGCWHASCEWNDFCAWHLNEGAA